MAHSVTKWAKSKKMIMLEEAGESPSWYFLTDNAYNYGKEVASIVKGDNVEIQTDGERDGLPVISNISKAESSNASSSTGDAQGSGNENINKQNVLKSLGAMLEIKVISEDTAKEICELYDEVYNHVYGK